jgi:hypothetical protein
MSIDETNKIDFWWKDNEKGLAILAISDHLDWDHSQGEHLALLQEKLNHYLYFIESGKMEQAKPAMKGLPVIIQVIGKYPLNEDARKFYRLAEKTLANAGASLEFQLFEDGQTQKWKPDALLRECKALRGHKCP